MPETQVTEILNGLAFQFNDMLTKCLADFNLSNWAFENDIWQSNKFTVICEFPWWNLAVVFLKI